MVIGLAPRAVPKNEGWTRFLLDVIHRCRSPCFGFIDCFGPGNIIPKCSVRQSHIQIDVKFPTPLVGLLKSHTFSQLTFTLLTLQLQSLNSVLQPFLLLDESSVFRCFCDSATSVLSLSIAHGAQTATRRLTAVIGVKSALLELALSFKGLFATGELFDVV